VTGPFELLILGGGPAGFSAARAYRDADGAGPVAIVTDEHRMPYRRPPLTKELLRGTSTEAELPLENETWPAAHDVGLISGHAETLDAEAHSVTLSGGRELPYRRCLIATGSEPTRLDVPGADDPAVRVVRALDHVRELQRRLSGDQAVVVIGSGFIGCEIAASLRIRGHQVSLVSDEPVPNSARLGEAAGSFVAGWLEQQGVELRLGTPVRRIERNGDELAVIADGATLRGQVVVMATGVAPRGELAASAGIELDGGAVPVDAAMRCADPGLLAAGDVCKADNVSAGRPLRVEHWGDALRQGEIAGAGAAGETVAWDEVPGFWSTIGDHTLKYAAWGDGHDEARVQPDSDGGFTVWYGRDDRLVGVLTHRADRDYERGRDLIREGASWS
jgi:3-phenylpropionate/trans-cinnamate dioxygenase ferredoxin reductase component